jgi:hypothetical protein
MQAISRVVTTAPLGGSRRVGTLFFGPEGIAFHTAPHPVWCRERPAPSWPEVIGGLEFSRGDWHCPRAALRRVEPGGWRSLVAKLRLGRRLIRRRGYLVHTDSTRHLLIPPASKEMFEAWIGVSGGASRACPQNRKG